MPDNFNGYLTRYLVRWKRSGNEGILPRYTNGLRFNPTAITPDINATDISNEVSSSRSTCAGQLRSFDAMKSCSVWVPESDIKGKENGSLEELMAYAHIIADGMMLIPYAEYRHGIVSAIPKHHYNLVKGLDLFDSSGKTKSPGNIWFGELINYEQVIAHKERKLPNYNVALTWWQIVRIYVLSPDFARFIILNAMQAYEFFNISSIFNWPKEYQEFLLGRKSFSKFRIDKFLKYIQNTTATNSANRFSIISTLYSSILGSVMHYSSNHRFYGGKHLNHIMYGVIAGLYHSSIDYQGVHPLSSGKYVGDYYFPLQIFKDGVAPVSPFVEIMATDYLYNNPLSNYIKESFGYCPVNRKQMKFGIADLRKKIGGFPIKNKEFNFLEFFKFLAENTKIIRGAIKNSDGPTSGTFVIRQDLFTNKNIDKEKTQKAFMAANNHESAIISLVEVCSTHNDLPYHDRSFYQGKFPCVCEFNENFFLFMEKKIKGKDKFLTDKKEEKKVPQNEKEQLENLDIKITDKGSYISFDIPDGIVPEDILYS